MVMVYFIPLVVIVITYSVILFTISRKTSVSGKGPSIIYISTLGYRDVDSFLNLGGLAVV